MYDKLRLLFKPCNTHFYKDKLYKNNKAEIDKNLENNSQKNNLNIVKVIFGDVIRSSIGVYIFIVLLISYILNQPPFSRHVKIRENN